MKKTISAFIRVGNEKNTILPCLESIKDIFDEYVIGYNNNSKDGSVDLIKKYIKDSDLKNYYLYHYNHSVIPPIADEYKNKTYNDDESLASYYNFVLSKIKTDMFAKIDCDQIYFRDILYSKINKITQSNNPYYGIVGYDTGVYKNYLLSFGPKKKIKGINADHFIVTSNSEITFIQEKYWELIKLPNHYYDSLIIDKEPVFFHFKKRGNLPTNIKKNISIEIIEYNKYVLPLLQKYNSEYQNLSLV